MATRRYSLNPGDPTEPITEVVGAATATKSIELTVDLAVVTSKMDVLIAIKKFKDNLVQGKWPPA